MLSFDHVGCAVANIRKAITAMETIGYNFGSVVDDETRGVSISFGHTGDFCVELVAPLRSGSPVDSVLNVMGPSPYHICYQSDEFEGDMERCVRGGTSVLLFRPPQ